MGMNYYYHTNICQHCQRSDRQHVGKKSHGWTFHFQGYRFSTGANQDIVSLADWARVFKTTAGVLVDEEERVIEDPLKFLAELERPTAEQQAWEDDPKNLGGHIRDDREWRDDEGFAFYDGYFS